MKLGDIALLGTSKTESLIMRTDINQETFERFRFLCEILNEARTIDVTLPIVESNCKEIEDLLSALSIPIIGNISPASQKRQSCIYSTAQNASSTIYFA